VADIGKIYHAQARFKDPFNEVVVGVLTMDSRQAVA
jgi:hypothetical protein